MNSAMDGVDFVEQFVIFGFDLSGLDFSLLSFHLQGPRHSQ